MPGDGRTMAQEGCFVLADINVERFGSPSMVEDAETGFYGSCGCQKRSDNENMVREAVKRFGRLTYCYKRGKVASRS